MKTTADALYVYIVYTLYVNQYMGIPIKKLTTYTHNLHQNKLISANFRLHIECMRDKRTMRYNLPPPARTVHGRPTTASKEAHRSSHYLATKACNVTRIV